MMHHFENNARKEYQVGILRFVGVKRIELWTDRGAGG